MEAAEVIPDMPNEDYHASPGLSASGAKLLLPPSCPAKYKHEREHPTYKDIYDFGSAAHKVVLSSDDVIVEVKADSWRTKAAQETRTQAREAGKIPLLTKHFEVVRAMAQKIREHPIASWLLDQPGKCEQSIFWADERTGVPLRSRLDFLPDGPADDGTTYLVDYKTTTDAEPDAFARTAMDCGYHVQDAFYSEATRQAGYENTTFLFIVQEKNPPYVVTVCELDSFARVIGRHLMRRAIDTYAECARTNTWPGYGDAPHLVTLPTYYTRQFEEIL